VHILRRTLLGASAVGLAMLLVSAALTTSVLPAGAVSVQPQIPQVAVAQAAANWIVTQQAADGSIGGSPSATANGILALVAAHDTAAAQSALSYMEANANAFISEGRTSQRGSWLPSRPRVPTPDCSGQRRSSITSPSVATSKGSSSPPSKQSGRPPTRQRSTG
jgi:hypothetical protein